MKGDRRRSRLAYGRAKYVDKKTGVSRRGGVVAVGPSTFAPANAGFAVELAVIADFIPDLGAIVIVNGAPPIPTMPWFVFVEIGQ